MPSSSTLAVCRATLASHIASEEHRDLDELTLKTVLALADRYVLPSSTENQIRSALWNIRHDYETVEALRSNCHCCHTQVWAAWFGQTRAILRHSNLDWSHDEAVEQDDLAQIAIVELLRSLGGFRYASRFSTWAYQVVTRGVQRHLRDQSAKKRSGVIERGTDPLTLALPIADVDLPETRAYAHSLADIVASELTRSLGARSAHIFRLWVCDDLSAETIGRHVGLSQARVYAIIAQARQHLSAQELILSWREAAYG